MTTQTLEQEEAIQTEITPLLQTAQSMVVKNHEQRTDAVSFVNRLKDLKKKIEDRFHPTANREKTLAAWKAAKDTENAFYEPIDQAADLAKRSITVFDREESIRAQREAEMAEAKRQEAERKERERLEALAKKAEEKGKTEKAEALREQAETVTVAPSFTPPPQPVKKLVWKARVVNTLLACKSVGEGLIPFSAVEFKQVALNDLGKSYDGKTQIPGINFYQDVNGRI